MAFLIRDVVLIGESLESVIIVQGSLFSYYELKAELVYPFDLSNVVR